MYPNPAAQAPYQQQYGAGYTAPYNPQQAYAQPYQQPPYVQQYPAQYAQPQAAFQAGFQQPPARTSQGPPQKKQKGNPVITRYPPPPGYKPPQNAQLPGVYQLPAPAYGAPGYAAPQAYQQPPPAVPGYPAQPSYPAQPGYPPQPAYPAVQGYQQPAYQAPYPTPPVAPAWQQPAQAPYVPPTPHPLESSYSQGDAYSTHVPTPSATGNATGHTRASSYDWSFEHDETDMAEVPEEALQPELSLGVIVWHPAAPRQRPLPSVYAEAELEALAPTALTKKEEECISRYFTSDKVHEVELSVKQTDEWEQVKDDSIFVEFAPSCEVVPIHQIIANRDRPDIGDECSEQGGQNARYASVEPSTEIQREPSVQPAGARQDTAVQRIRATRERSMQATEAAEQTDDDQEMDMSMDEDSRAPSRAQSRAPSRAPSAAPAHAQGSFDGLEQALDASNYPAGSRRPSVASNAQGMGRSRSRHGSRPLSRQGSRPRGRQSSQAPQGKPIIPPPKDNTQENILASLGVEGSPKMLYATPGPAYGPSVTSGQQSGTNSRHGSVGAMTPNNYNDRTNTYQPIQYGPNSSVPPPPPPQHARSPSYDPWQVLDAGRSNGRGGDSPRSTASRGTATGSDFAPIMEEDNEATPKARPTLKRPFEDSEPDVDTTKRHDDDTPKARRTGKKPHAGGAYGRRW